MFFLILLSSRQSVSAQFPAFGPGFNPIESEEILRLNLAFVHKDTSVFLKNIKGDYQEYHRSVGVGLDNAGDI